MRLVQWSVRVVLLAAGFVVLASLDASFGYLAYLGDWWWLLAWLIGIILGLFTLALGFMGMQGSGWVFLTWPAFALAHAAFLVASLAAAHVVHLDLHGRVEPAAVTQIWTDPDSQKAGLLCSFSAVTGDRSFGVMSSPACDGLVVGQHTMVTWDPTQRASPVLGESRGLYPRQGYVRITLVLLLLAYVAFLASLIVRDEERVGPRAGVRERA